MEINKYEAFAQGVFVEQMTPLKRLQGVADALRPVKTKIDFLRIGGKNDGGYLIPDDLEGIKECFSPGVDVTCTFEMDLLNRGIFSHLADYSVDRPAGFEMLSFTKRYIGAVNDDMFITLDAWVKEKASQGDLLLQMDIEGGEYIAILGATEETLKKFRIILIEIHSIESWGHPSFFCLVETVFMKLLKHFYVLHNHPNNCFGIVNLGGFEAPRVFELMLLRKDRAEPIGFVDRFPHPLDRPNIFEKSDLTLPENWYKGG